MLSPRPAAPVFCINVHKPLYRGRRLWGPGRRRRKPAAALAPGLLQREASPEERASPRRSHGASRPNRAEPWVLTLPNRHWQRPAEMRSGLPHVTRAAPLQTELVSRPWQRLSAAPAPACRRGHAPGQLPHGHTAHTVTTTACSEAHDFSAEDGWSEVRTRESPV